MFFLRIKAIIKNKEYFFMDHSFLSGSDFVGITFWIVSIAMWASTIFFFYEGMRVSSKWRTSMVVAV